jgi:hypothetical protein
VEAQGRRRVRGQLARLAALEVRVEHETRFIDVLDQHETQRRATARVRRGKRGARGVERLARAGARKALCEACDRVWLGHAAKKVAPNRVPGSRTGAPNAYTIALCNESGYAGVVRKRYFTLAEANALLPRLRPRIERMMQLSAHLRSNAEGEKTPTPPGTPWLADPVLAAWQANDPEKTRVLAACLYETLSEELKALELQGIQVKDLSIGLLDFPSLLEGHTEVLLCWRLDERQIGYFHTPSSGYRGRKSVEGHSFEAGPNPSGQLRE